MGIAMRASAGLSKMTQDALRDDLWRFPIGCQMIEAIDELAR